MTIKDRIEVFISYKGIKRAVFEKTCGFSNGYTRNLKENPSATKIEDILTAYPELNRVWLLSGEGEMLKSETINIKTSEVSGNGNSIGSPVNQNIGEVSGQNAGRDIHIAASCDNEIWLKELEKQRLLTEKAQSIAETAQNQLTTALAQITDLIKQNKEQFNQFMGLLQTLKSV